MAIDPERLKLELDQLTALASDPQRLQRQVLELLERYQVRRRSDGRLQSSVPRPVLRSMARALRAELRGDSAATAEVASALWKADRHDTRNLAAQLLVDLEGEPAAELIERWIHGPVSLELVRELAEVGLQGWRRRDPDGFLDRSREWIGDKHRLLGLYALHAAARDPQFEHLPRVYRLIEGLGGSLRGRPRRALLELMRALAGRAPVETVQFLRRELLQSGSAAHRLVAELLPSLPPEQRQALRSPNGIIPARADHPQDGERER